MQANNSTHERLNHLLQEKKIALKDLKKNKAEIARQFKEVTADSEMHTSLIAAMQDISSQLKTVEVDIKSLEKQLNQADEKIPTVTHAATPPLFTIDESSIFSHEFSIREVNNTELSLWHDFISTKKNVPPYHYAAWLEVIEKSFSNPTRVWCAFDSNGKVIGGIPLTFFSSKLFGKFAVSIPYVNYGGVITSYFNIATALLKELPKLCCTENLSHIEMRSMQSNLAEQASSKKASMILALPESVKILDENLGSKVRAQYNKADEHKPIARFGKLELLNDFYTVFAKNMRDLGTPVYGKNWFRNILTQPKIDATLVVIYVNKKPVSTGFLVGHNKMLEIPWASTIKEANALNTNMWMYRQILGFAIEHHYHFFDFGRSTLDAGTYKFKKQWGAQPHQHYWYKFTSNGSDTAPELNPDNPKFKLMIAVWKRLPVWLTKIIGPPIIRNIP